MLEILVIAGILVLIVAFLAYIFIEFTIRLIDLLVNAVYWVVVKPLKWLFLMAIAAITDAFAKKAAADKREEFMIENGLTSRTPNTWE